MVWFIISLLSVICAVAGILIYCWYTEQKSKLKCLWGLLALLLMFPGFISTIATGEVGIKTTWGKITGTNLKEGVQFKAPWQNIIKMNIKVQKYENEVALETSTKDMQIVTNVKVSINYQLDEDSAVNIYRKVGENYGLVILEPAIQEAVKGTISQFNAEEMVNKRNEVSTAIQETLKTKVNEYGLNILSVSLNNFDFSAEYNASIERKTVAEQNALAAQQELEISKAEAEKKKVDAQGEADANKIKEETITDKILMQQFIEKWNGELPKVSGGDNLFDITELLK